MQLSIFSSAEHHANPSASPASEKDWMIRVATSRSSILPLLTNIAPAGWFGRTSPASCRMEQELLVPSSEGWGNSGMGSPTEFLTLNTSEFHSGAVACSLSDVLETGDVPQRFFLSARACKGILRRAVNRGKELPQQLARALKAVADSAQTSTATAARLQGFPDDYTLIEYNRKPAKDAPRYKALGNSMAVPVMRWIGERIAAVDQIEEAA
jgi:hypothetical protein